MKQTRTTQAVQNGQARGAPNPHSGQAIIIATVFFFFITFVIVFGMTAPVVGDLVSSIQSRHSSESYFLAEAALEDMTYRLVEGMATPAVSTIALYGSTAEVTVSDTGSGKELVATGDVANADRVARVVLDESSSGSASFHYGVQVDEGGYEISGGAQVFGNLYSNGPVLGPRWYTWIDGDVISAGLSGVIDGIRAGGSAFADTMIDSTINGDAYYQSISNTSVLGTQYPGSPSQPTAPLPITDDMIDDWKTQAEAGGTHSGACPYTIGSNTQVSLGPIKIPCDVTIAGSADVTFTGHVWVEGNINLEGGATMKVDAGLSGESVAFIASESDTASGSQINAAGGFEAISSNGYVVLISENDSASNGGSNTAINAAGGAFGDLVLYANHGLITLAGGADIIEMAAYEVDHSNGDVYYDTGLASIVFTSGPSGGYTVAEWKEIQ